MTKPKRFYDTSALLTLQEKCFDEPFFISYMSLAELENIKTSSSKDQDTKYRARQIVRLLNEREDDYIIINESNERCEKLNIRPSNDNIILAGAWYVYQTTPIIFYTDDILMKLHARNMDLNVKLTSELLSCEKDEYLGYKEVTLDDVNMAHFYENLNQNQFLCRLNEYVVLKSEDGAIKDVRKWTNNGYVDLYRKSIKTLSFGDKIRPKDVYQQMAVDSIMTNTMTVITGKAGSGKSLLSLVCAMNLIESGKYERLVILFNPTSTRGAEKLGYYSGNALEKAMQTSIGNILTSKYGDRYAVDLMLQNNKLRLVSMADSRGFEVKDEEILFITEGQNTSTELLKVCLTRSCDNSKIIIEGDYKSQVDNSCFENGNNGLKRVIDVLKGEDIVGYVNLKTIYRSRIANLVDKL